MTSNEAIDALAERAQLAWENRRYDARYAIDLPELLKRLVAHVPVVHLGQVEAVGAVRDATPDARWLVVYLWCPRDLAQSRIDARGTGDTNDRLRAWDETVALRNADLTLNTAELSAEDAAHRIHRHVAAVCAALS